MSTYLILSIVVGLVALGVAVMLSNAISAANAGTARMKEIAGYIHEGAMAFLYREYKYLAIFIVVVAAIIATFLSVSTALCFIGGAVFSICAGYLGMNVATKANVRTAEAARHGMSEALKIAFSGGAVMGLGVVGLGIAGLAVAYFVFDRNIDIVTGFGLGASSIALFARVGGGIYTKAADVGADLVGKVEAGIPEDDPRNPRFDIRYKDVPDKELPRTESLKDTVERILPYWKEVIFPTLRTADQILVAAHGNSLRGIIKYLKNISDEEIVHLNLPTAVPYVFEFDDDLKLVNDYFLGDPEEIKKLMEAVANQGKKK